MIRFTWNNVVFDIADMGGGLLLGAIPSHAHAKNSYELHFIIDGKGMLIASDKEYALKKGDFFITGPGIYHSQISDEVSPMKDVFLNIHAVDLKSSNAVSTVFLENDFYFVENVDFSTAKEILEEYNKKLPDYQTVVAGLACKLLTHITRLFLPKSFKESGVSGSLNDKRFIIIEQAFLYDENITLSGLSDRIGLCERQTQRLLKKYYGKTFRDKKREIYERG